MSVKMDLATPREHVQVLPHLRAVDASNQDQLSASLPWEPAFDLVAEAATKIALYEKSFHRLEELAERNADQAEADRCALMDRIADLAQRLQESEANYEKTLGLLEASTQICMLQRMELQVMRETLSEGSSHASLMTACLKHLTVIASRTQDGEPAEPTGGQQVSGASPWDEDKSDSV